MATDRWIAMCDIEAELAGLRALAALLRADPGTPLERRDDLSIWVDSASVRIERALERLRASGA